MIHVCPHRPRSKVTSFFVWTIVVGLLAFQFALLYFQTSSWNSPPPDLDNALTSTKSQIRFGQRDICLGVAEFIDTRDNFALLSNIVEKLEAFHNHGGNLKALELYLNSHIDDTYKTHGYKFVPNGDDTPISDKESTSKFVKDLLQKNDVHKRGGYDQRQLPGSFINHNGEVLHEGRIIEVLEPWNDERWDVGLGPIATNLCKSLDTIRSRSNRRGYDDKFMCSYNELQAHLQQQQQQKEQEKCEMISIGSNGQWGFEESVTANGTCVAHTFDCTIKNPNKPSSGDIYFYPYCISNRNHVEGDRQFATFSELMKIANMTKSPSLFKMDVEGFEYDVLVQMLQEARESGSMNMLPVQISVEFHYATRMYDVPWLLRSLTAAEIAVFIGLMYNQGGYVLVNYERIGPGCHSCAELLFMRVFC